MPYLVRVSLHPVCLSAKCTNHSDTLDMHDFTTLFANTICLTPARRQKLYVDRAELALKLSRVFIAACSDSDKDFTTMGPSKSRYQRPGEG